jgi:membrane protein implicated in regulation of membrane protease activity
LTELEKIIPQVDERFEFRNIFPLQILAALVRIIFLIAIGGLLLLGYYYSLIAQSAAVANLLNTSLALQSLTISLLALVITIFAVFFNEERKQEERIAVEGLVFRKLKGIINDPVALRGLIRMKMTLPKGISLKDAYNVNSELFTRKELARRLLE